MWHGGTIKSQIYQNLTKYQKVDHFPRSFEITRKDSLYNRIARAIHLHGYKHFSFAPKTFTLPNEWQALIEAMDEDKNKVWIIKPAAAAQGRGIFFTSNHADIPQKQPMIASHYINNPHLLDGYKYDLRVYVVITSMNPLRIYVYDDGLTRFATSKYTNDVTDKHNKYAHLTNYSINKFNANFLQN